LPPSFCYVIFLDDEDECVTFFRKVGELLKVEGLISVGLDVIIGRELRMKARHARKNVQAVEFCVW
jgi:hypothetical protein